MLELKPIKLLTIKGKGNETGTTRLEWEREIAVSDAEKLLTICESGMIDKIRHEVKVGNHVYEVDVFSGDNEGLIIAEIELQSEEEVLKNHIGLEKKLLMTSDFIMLF